MKKCFLFLLLSAISFLNFSQNVKKIELHDSIRQAYLQKVFPLSSYCVDFDDYGNMTENLVLGTFDFFVTSKFDTLILFNGKLCPGHEKGLVNLYQSKNGKPTSILSERGKIASLENDEIWIYDYPCCAEVLNLIAKYSMTTGEKLSETHVFYSRKDFKNVFPILENTKENYQLSRDSELRWSPFTTDRANVPVCRSWENVIDTLRSGTSFTLIKIASNNWALIRLDNQVLSEGYCISDYYQQLIGDETYSLYGWVRAENIEKK